MSDLKYLTKGQLEDAKLECENKIKYHQRQICGQRVRLQWIEHYMKVVEEKPKLIKVKYERDDGACITSWVNREKFLKLERERDLHDMEDYWKGLNK